MGEKISTIILTVDLDCCKCSKKIRTTICKLKERESIQTVNFDLKKNTVTISGPFDPEKLYKKLCCKARKVIKDIQIKKEEIKKAKDETKDETQKEKAKDATKDEPKKTNETKDEGKKTKDETKVGPDPGCTCGCRPCHGGCYGSKCPWCGRWYRWLPECSPPMICAEHPGCTCGCRPSHGGCYGDYKCPGCGRCYRWLPECSPPMICAVPPPQPCDVYKTCTFICEEAPQSPCTIM